MNSYFSLLFQLYNDIIDIIHVKNIFDKTAINIVTSNFYKEIENNIIDLSHKT